MKDSKWSSGKRTKVIERDYKCPECGGEFNKWENAFKSYEPSQCPFCGLKKKSYSSEKDKTLKDDRGEQ